MADTQTLAPAPAPTGDARPAPERFAEQYVPRFVDKWDALIDWDRRKASEADFFVERLRAAGARRVLDVAAGTGFHSVALIEAGFEVVAVDGSAAMLEQARANAARRGHTLEAIHADWRELGTKVTGTFDAVVCLGSSFPHLFDAGDRRHVLGEFAARIAPGGLLMLDHRNFDAIRAHRYKSSGNFYYCGTGAKVSVDHADETLCRFRYDFADRETYTLEVYPVLENEMRGLLEDAGFEAVETFGDFKRVFDIYATDFVIHVARRP
ncbi:class I SAM-dependent methyltransferase [Salinarimonas ramus]|uniref:Type 11 methyltransferase n=1 Tax=Salinarimonas ramus TaxID=690164 RepID=A0A917QGI2_9HYPH|nr:class I SAM-dependent methyltransferase [Salinarimonas ramus]GGK49535.1 type 11 methyltransferase [Salinarimonas ramus]